MEITQTANLETIPPFRYYDPGKTARDSVNNAYESGCSYKAVTYATDPVDSVSKFKPQLPFKGIHVGVAGNVTIVGMDGASATFTALSAGLWPYAGQAILASTTTATGLIAIF